MITKNMVKKNKKTKNDDIAFSAINMIMLFHTLLTPITHRQPRFRLRLLKVPLLYHHVLQLQLLRRHLQHPPFHRMCGCQSVPVHATFLPDAVTPVHSLHVHMGVLHMPKKKTAGEKVGETEFDGIRSQRYRGPGVVTHDNRTQSLS